MRRQVVFYPLLALAFLVIAMLACGSETKGEKVGETESGKAESEQSTPELEIFKVGDIIKVSDHTIALNSATFASGKLTANFTIENQGADDLSISTMLSFEARGNDGTTLDEAIFDCSSGLGGKILPGDKMRGNICWKDATPPAKIYYEAKLFSSGAIVWEVR